MQYENIDYTPRGNTRLAGSTTVSSARLVRDENLATMINPNCAGYLPSGDQRPCLLKTFPLNANIMIDSKDLIIVISPESGAQTFGEIYIKNGAVWTFSQSIATSVSMSNFIESKLVSSALTVFSDTVSTTNTVLSGRLSAVSTYEVGKSIPSFENMGQYVVSPSYSKINVSLVEGIVTLPVPSVNRKSYSTEALYGDSIQSLTSQAPIISAAGAFYNNYSTGMYCLSGKPILVQIGASPSSTTGIKCFNSAGTQLGSAFRMDNFAGLVSTQIFYPPVNTASLLFESAGGPALNGTLAVWTLNPIYAYDATLKTIVYVQGNVGTKNINISGAARYQLYPSAENIQQTSFTEIIAFNPAMFEAFKILMDSFDFFNTVCTRDEYLSMVALTQYVSLEEVANLNHASAASFAILPLIKKGVSVLKNLGISPAKILRKGLDFGTTKLRKGIDSLENMGMANIASAASLVYVTPRFKLQGSYYVPRFLVLENIPLANPTDPHIQRFFNLASSAAKVSYTQSDAILIIKIEGEDFNQMLLDTVDLENAPLKGQYIEDLSDSLIVRDFAMYDSHLTLATPSVEFQRRGSHISVRSKITINTGINPTVVDMRYAKASQEEAIDYGTSKRRRPAALKVQAPSDLEKEQVPAPLNDLLEDQATPKPFDEGTVVTRQLVEKALTSFTSFKQQLHGSVKEQDFNEELFSLSPFVAVQSVNENEVDPLLIFVRSGFVPKDGNAGYYSLAQGVFNVSRMYMASGTRDEDGELFSPEKYLASLTLFPELNAILKALAKLNKKLYVDFYAGHLEGIQQDSWVGAFLNSLFGSFPLVCMELSYCRIFGQSFITPVGSIADKVSIIYQEPTEFSNLWVLKQFLNVPMVYVATNVVSIPTLMAKFKSNEFMSSTSSCTVDQMKMAGLLRAVVVGPPEFYWIKRFTNADIAAFMLAFESHIKGIKMNDLFPAIKEFADENDLPWDNVSVETRPKVKSVKDEILNSNKEYLDIITEAIHKSPLSDTAMQILANAAKLKDGGLEQKQKDKLKKTVANQIVAIFQYLAGSMKISSGSKSLRDYNKLQRLENESQATKKVEKPAPQKKQNMSILDKATMVAGNNVYKRAFTELD